MVGAERVLSGKLCLVTGATSGIGAVTARELAALGATVVLVGRDRARCDRQARDVARRTGSEVVPLVADLSSQQQVRAVADAVRRLSPRLDVLVNNAGSYFMVRRLSVDGVEMTLALNHLAPFLLTALLLPSLRASRSARVVNVSSGAHARASLDLEDLQGERRYERLEAYGRAKLAQLLFTYELARRVRGTSVTSNAFDPGLVATNLGADNGWLRVKLRNLLTPGMVRPEVGARTGIHLAASPQVEGVTGRYFRECREVPSSAESRDEEAARRLWRASERLVRLSAQPAAGAPRAGRPPGPPATPPGTTAPS
jgi:NAD(P)-dependent dehydrogenase (short-subunit alcohol dehydrogenase family)